MKKSIVFVSVLLTILLSSCSMLNKNSGKEVSVSIDTKPLANYARIFCDEVVKPEQEPESGSEDPLNSFIIKVNLSGDFRDEIEELREVSFEKLIANPETLNFKFDNLEFTPGAKAKVKAEVLLNLVDIEIPVTISNSLFSAEKEQTLAEENNTFSLEMNYASPEWPTEGVLSYLPPLEDFWFYTEETFENGKCWTIYTKNKNMTKDEIEGYYKNLIEQQSILYDEQVKSQLLKYYGYSDEYNFQVYHSELYGNNFTFDVSFYKEAEPVIDYRASFIYGDLSTNNDIDGIPYGSQEIILPQSGYSPITGYEFAGWYTDEKFSGEAITTYTFQEDETEKTFYAKFNPIEYTITYITEFGELPDDAVRSYTIEDDVELPELSAEGHEFIGWYDERNQKIESWGPGNKTEDLNLTAYWDEAPVVEEVEITLNYVFVTSDGRSFSADSLDTLKNSLVAIPSALLNLSYTVVYTNEDDSITGTIKGNQLSLPEGNYKLLISATGENEESFSKTMENFNVSKFSSDNSSKKIEFKQDEINKELKGSVALPFFIDAPVLPDHYTVSASGNYNLESETFTEMNSWNKEGLTPAAYNTKFEFFSDEAGEKSAFTQSVTVYVWPGFTTDMFIGPEGSVTEDNQLLIIPTYEMKLEDPVMS